MFDIVVMNNQWQSRPCRKRDEWLQIYSNDPEKMNGIMNYFLKFVTVRNLQTINS